MIEYSPAAASVCPRERSPKGRGGELCPPVEPPDSNAGYRLREMLRRAAMNYEDFARAIGKAGGSSVQRYLDPDRDSIPLHLIEPIASALVGRGTPPITQAEVKALAWPSASAKTARHGDIDLAVVAEVAAHLCRALSAGGRRVYAEDLAAMLHDALQRICR
jgi:hypothetical protein